MKSAQALLQDVFGYEQFRGAQADVIEAVMQGHDAMVLMPTGGGKSLCYQVPAILREGVGIVVSPLIALMQDQVAALAQLGVKAAVLNSSLSYDEQMAVERAIGDQSLDLVYMAPERLMQPGCLQLLSSVPIALFAIDEAHCVSQWGHDFRKEYLQLGQLADLFSGVPRMALTATADNMTRKEILSRLALDEADVFITGFDRPNIRYDVVSKTQASQQLLRFIEERHAGDSGIVYCQTRKKVDKTCEWLNRSGIKALAYHAGMGHQERTENQRQFILESGWVMVATVAFGMGVDKPDVRFVAHVDMPKSLEAYYQETGRAGRDGLPATAWMAYGLGDLVGLGQFIDNAETDENRKRIEREKMEAMLGYCETTCCRRQVLLEYFGETLAEPCGNCDTCLEPVETFDATEVAQKALSTVYRTGQRFGAGHLIDILLGAETERIQRFHHNQLSTYGIGTELNKQQWRSVFRQLIANRLLIVDSEGYGGLKLCESCRSILRGERRLAFRQEVIQRRKKAKTVIKPVLKQVLADANAEKLFEVLRALRRELAEEQGVPPYVIFHDKTLIEMANHCPKNLSEMADIHGVGTAKLERYGEAFLKVFD